MAGIRTQKIEESSESDHDDHDDHEKKKEKKEEVEVEEAEERDAYSVLGVRRDASDKELRKAYHRLALRLHPDKLVHLKTHEEKQEAKEKFQSLQKIFSVLSDPEKRKVYDQTGSLDDSDTLAGEDFDNLYKYYRTVFKKVTEDDILAFERQYRGSKEETEDLIKYYTQFSGDMDKVFAWLCCSRPNLDSHRFMETIDGKVKEGVVQSHRKYTQWANKVAAKPKPRKDPLQVQEGGGGGGKKAIKGNNKKKKAGAGGMDSLIMQIQSKQKGRMESLFANLEEKYGKKEKKKGKKRKVQKELTDEEFERARGRLFNKGK